MPTYLDENGNEVDSSYLDDMGEITLTPAQMQSSGEATTAVNAARGVPAVGRGVARFVANHPALAQKTIGAGTTMASSLLGGAIGSGAGPTGAIAGALGGGMVRGLTPTQAGIRTTMGQLGGEAPEVARTAGRAMAAANYGKELGLNVRPTGLISTGEAAVAFDNYADSQGLKAPRVLDQYGKVVYGPEAPPKPKVPSKVGGALRTSASTLGKVLGPLSVMTGATDLAQTIEPTRQDIGVMGIGKSVDVPGMHPTALEQLRQAILAQLGY